MTEREPRQAAGRAPGSVAQMARRDRPSPRRPRIPGRPIPGAHPPMPSTRSILLVEEDAVCRGFLADNLTADGYEVIVAAEKADAIAKLTTGPDLVLCDVNGHTLQLLDAVRGAAGLAARIDPMTPLI